jgi:hypothetical protein
MKKFVLTVDLEFGPEVYQELAAAILEDQTLDWALLGTDEEAVTERLASGAEFQALVQNHIRQALERGWRPDYWDYIDVGELESDSLSAECAENHWLLEAIERSEAHWAEVEHQQQLLREAAEAERLSTRRVQHQSMIDHLRAAGYVVYEKPQRRK